MSKLLRGIKVAALVICFFGLPGLLIAGDNQDESVVKFDNFKVAKGKLLVGFKKGASNAVKSSVHSAIRAKVQHRFKTIGVDLVSLPKGMSFKEAIQKYEEDPSVRFVEPDYVIELEQIIPNDPSFEDLWGLHNIGQSGGTFDADIDAPEAWEITTGSHSVVVAVIDTGVDYNHEDLQANMWVNIDEYYGVPNVDDDNNGYIDDIHGINVINGTGDPMDDHNHGTHCAGTIGALGNNEIGVVGVNHNVSIMALKFLSSSGWGYTSDAVKCVNYARSKGADIASNSWGGGSFSQTLYDAIEAFNKPFIAAAGNWSDDTDSDPHYPSCYDLPNVVSVMSTDRNDSKSYFSNYGAASVDLAAPGSYILSTTPGDTYATYSGTSMATPHVAGVAALVKAQYPDLQTQEIINRIYLSVDQLDCLIGKCTTTGRLNAHKAVDEQTPVYGSIKVNISPYQAVSDGARWTWVGSGIWYNSGVTVSDVPVGTRTVICEQLSEDDWITPVPQTVEVNEGQLSSCSMAYVSLWPGPDNNDYIGTASYDGFEDISTTGNPIEFDPVYSYNPAEDDGRQFVPIGFGYNYYGAIYSHVFVFTNGVMSFNNPNINYYNRKIPDNLKPASIIAPFWDDLHLYDDGYVVYEVKGSAPNRRCIIQWCAYRCYYSNYSTVLFQVRLHESGKIEFCYDDVEFVSSWYSSYNNGKSATIGIQNNTGDPGLMYSYNGSRPLTDRHTITFVQNQAPEVESLSPSKGKGSSDTFTAVYSDQDGVENLKYLYFLANNRLSGISAAYLYYRVKDNKFFMRNDSNSAWGTGYSPGETGVLDNSQVNLDLSTASASASGNEITLNLPLSFSSEFSGLQQLYVKATDAGYATSGWIKMGNYEVETGLTDPETLSINPDSGSGSSQTFTAVYSDPQGHENLRYLYFMANGDRSGGNAAYLVYAVGCNKLYLRNDANSSWGAGYPVGSANILENSQVSLNLSAASAVKSGNEITLNLPLDFKPAFAGDRNIYMLAKDWDGNSSSWSMMGSYTVKATFSPEVKSLNPESGSGSSQTFTAVYGDPQGHANLRYLYFLANDTRSGGNAVYLVYAAGCNKLYLRNDANSTWGAGYPVGSANTLENSQMSLNLSAASAQKSGNEITLTLPLAFKPSFCGARNIYMLAKDWDGNSSNWKLKGTYTVE